jgi:hypothetical protein
MSDNESNKVPRHKNSETHWLNYQSTSRIKWWQDWSKAGIASLIALILWFPWGGAWFLFFWIYAGHDTPTSAEENLFIALVIVPVLVAFGFGLYSMKTHGLSRRNIPGSIGFILSATWVTGVIVVLVIELCSWLRHR